MGIRQNDVLDGKIPIIVNAYGGTSVVDWEPSQAETPAPVPTWAWVLVILIGAFGLFYGVQHRAPSEDFARTPTYGSFSRSQGPVAAAAAVATPSWPGAVSQSLAAPQADRGAALYAVNCSACHQADGRGLPGLFPPLADDPIVTTTNPAEHISTVLHGKQGVAVAGVSYASPMPAFQGILNDADIAAIINHERTSWGNLAPLADASNVATLRRDSSSR